MSNNILNVHSIESFATFEGERIRYALFLIGCPYRCVYCHNPDTWYAGGAGKHMTVDEIITQIDHYKAFYKNGGGLTVSGGEPLLQSEAVEELFKRVKELGLTNTIDTSCAVIPKNIETLLNYTDLVIVDLKFHNNEDYHKFANGSLGNTIKMLDILKNRQIKVWIRTVIVPNINDTKSDIDKYTEIVKEYKSILGKYQLLGYHTMGNFKYQQLGIKYALEGVKDLDENVLVELQNYADEKLK